ncbi:MAG: hypothetical protein WC112_09635 [Proteiniphilum sp.]
MTEDELLSEETEESELRDEESEDNEESELRDETSEESEEAELELPGSSGGVYPHL